MNWCPLAVSQNFYMFTDKSDSRLNAKGDTNNYLTSFENELIITCVVSQWQQ